jgi:uncharacterized membrane protein
MRNQMVLFFLFFFFGFKKERKERTKEKKKKKRVRVGGRLLKNVISHNWRSGLLFFCYLFCTGHLQLMAC